MTEEQKKKLTELLKKLKRMPEFPTCDCPLCAVIRLAREVEEV